MLTEAVERRIEKCACQQEGAVVAAGEGVTAAKHDVTVVTYDLVFEPC